MSSSSATQAGSAKRPEERAPSRSFEDLREAGATALGAQTADILRLVIVEAMSPALAGIAVGTIAVFAFARVLKSLVFAVSATDPLTLAAVAATLAAVAVAASLVPAYRASRLDPVNGLRGD